MINQSARKLLKINLSGSKLVARHPAQKKFNFTKKAIDALPCPSNGQRAYCYDTGVRGLTVAVSPAGKKVFVLYRKVGGRPERVTIGPYPDLSIEQARGKAEELNGAIARGENPAAKRREIRQEATLGELFDTYLEHHAKRLHKRTWPADLRRFELHLHGWRLRKLSSIKAFDVVRLHARIGRTAGLIAANRTVQMLRRLVNKALDWGWHGDNPAEGVELNEENSRERFLQAGELPHFFRALAEELNETIRDYVLLSLLTGARKSNVLQMRWQQINWDRNVWIIPRTKNGKPQDVPLSPQALAVLDRRKQSTKSEWVFPGSGRTGHLVEAKSAWKRITHLIWCPTCGTPQQPNEKCLRDGCEADLRKIKSPLTDLRLHDLRRSLGSWEAATGATLPIIGKSLGHRSPAATQIYARLDLDPVRVAVNKATNAMLLAGGMPLLKGERNG